jgi:hypothetical protein
MKLVHSFIKEDGVWYIDLPEFIEAGLGTQANLMMVAGADTFLDLLDEEGTGKVTLTLSTAPFLSAGAFKGKIEFEKLFMDMEELAKYDHPPVEFGANYIVTRYQSKKINHRMWLCPVTLYVFGGEYPKEIYFSKHTNK